MRGVRDALLYPRLWLFKSNKGPQIWILVLRCASAVKGYGPAIPVVLRVGISPLNKVIGTNKLYVLTMFISRVLYGISMYNHFILLSACAGSLKLRAAMTDKEKRVSAQNSLGIPHD